MALMWEDHSDYVLTDDSVWITVSQITVHIARHDEGVSVSLYPTNFEDEDSLAEMWATFAEAKQWAEDINKVREE